LKLIEPKKLNQPYNRFKPIKPNRTTRELQKKTSKKRFEIGLHLPPAGSTGSGVWDRTRTKPNRCPALVDMVGKIAARLKGPTHAPKKGCDRQGQHLVQGTHDGEAVRRLVRVHDHVHDMLRCLLPSLILMQTNIYTTRKLLFTNRF
jgi:hypothetical protein